MIYDIAIIGSGPNGDALACALADTNLKIVIIDKPPQNHHKTQAYTNQTPTNPDRKSVV